MSGVVWEPGAGLKKRVGSLLDSISLTRLIGLCSHFAYWRLLKEQGDGAAFAPKVRR